MSRSIRWLACGGLCLCAMVTSGYAQPAAPPAVDPALAQKQRLVVEQFLIGRVLDAITKARADLRTDPRGAVDLLKQALQAVLSTPEISADIRDALRLKLEDALRDASRVLEMAIDAWILQDVSAAIEERQRALAGLRARNVKLDALLTRASGLMDERNYREAELLMKSAHSDAAHSDAAYGSQGPWSEQANMVGVRAELASIREAHARACARALLSLERSTVPAADEPPLVYPDPEVWMRLTARRRQYSAVDLEGPAARRILPALDESRARLEFIEVPLTDVIEFLKDEHEIPIQFDKKALEDEGIESSTPITMNLSGITLRTGLRMMLQPLGLTCQIKNEVLLITTQVKAAEDLIAKVYPVAHPAIPIEPPPSGKIGLSCTPASPAMVGGNACFGGGAMGMGGGGMGMGGGMGGLGAPGGGGGFFNIAPPRPR